MQAQMQNTTFLIRLLKGKKIEKNKKNISFTFKHLSVF